MMHLIYNLTGQFGILMYKMGKTNDKEMLEMKKHGNYFKTCSGPFPPKLIDEEGTPHPFIRPTSELIKEVKPTKELTKEEIEEILRPK